jgi:hypothetical protein
VREDDHDERLRLLGALNNLRLTQRPRRPMLHLAGAEVLQRLITPKRWTGGRDEEDQRRRSPKRRNQPKLWLQHQGLQRAAQDPTQEHSTQMVPRLLYRLPKVIAYQLSSSSTQPGYSLLSLYSNSPYRLWNVPRQLSPHPSRRSWQHRHFDLTHLLSLQWPLST